MQTFRDGIEIVVEQISVGVECDLRFTGIWPRMALPDRYELGWEAVTLSCSRRVAVNEWRPINTSQGVRGPDLTGQSSRGRDPES